MNNKKILVDTIQTPNIHKKLIKCSECNYMCRIEWKKCPICKTSLLKKLR